MARRRTADLNSAFTYDAQVVWIRVASIQLFSSVSGFRTLASILRAPEFLTSNTGRVLKRS